MLIFPVVPHPDLDSAGDPLVGDQIATACGALATSSDPYKFALGASGAPAYVASARSVNNNGNGAIGIFDAVTNGQFTGSTTRFVKDAYGVSLTPPPKFGP